MTLLALSWLIEETSSINKPDLVSKPAEDALRPAKAPVKDKDSLKEDTNYNGVLFSTCCNYGCCDCGCIAARSEFGTEFGGDVESNVVANDDSYVLISTSIMKIFGLIIGLIVVWNILLNILNCKLRNRLKQEQNYQHVHV